MRVRGLLEEIEKLRAHTKTLIELRIRALHVGAELDQIRGLLVERQSLANLLRGRGFFRSGDFVRQAADGTQYVDGRIMPGRGQIAGKNQVAVQDAARGVANGFVEIVAFHQDREKSGNRAGLEVSGALKNLGQERVHGRRITLLAGRLSRGQSDFALRHGQPRHRIHHQEHVHCPDRENIPRRPAPRYAARIRSGAGRSDVAATTTERFMPSGPSS